ncbi:hypothetical protein ACIP1V_01785 [Kocuria marina]|uniref:hypothetical protein n=1 Tax=Kocuria marina TaxID=223184 RepID=UPI00382F0996
MAIQKRFPVQQLDVFPSGCYVVSEVEAVRDYDLAAGADGLRPQKLDKDSGLPV